MTSLLSTLLKSAPGPITQLLAGVLGSYFTMLNLSDQKSGAVLQKVAALMSGQGVAYTDANDQDMTEGALGVLDALLTQMKLTALRADLTPVLSGVGVRLAARPSSTA